ncbi:MAG: phenylalanine--tRNA ligase subunit beta, partial [Bacteroidia bacterium]
IVDITNYVMHDLGQPLHAFDLSQIKGNKIVVRRSELNETLTTLDDIERKLDGTELLICDNERALAFAGVLGGLDSGINENTTDVLIESAYFNPSVVRRAAKKHQISTDASFRFERGANYNITVQAMNYAAELMEEIADGRADENINDAYLNQIEQPIIDLNLEYLYTVIGEKIDKIEIIDILERLEFDVKDNGETLKITSPSSKPDVTRPIDVVEEVLRIYGYNTVDFDERMTISIPSNKKGASKALFSKVGSILNGEGFSEIKSSPFTNALDEKGIEILNPLSAEMTHLRASHIQSGLSSIAYNINRQQKNVRFYEIANEYAVNNGEYKENQTLTIWLTGNDLVEDSWNLKNRKSSFFTLKSVVSKLYSGLNLKHSPLQAHFEGDWFYGLVDKENSLRMGRLNEELCHANDIDEPVFVAQIQFKSLLHKFSKQKIRFNEPSKFPQMVRDLSFVIDEKIKYQQIEKAVSTAKTKFLKQTSCFDLYKGKPLDSGFASYALRFTFENKDKTLNDKQVEFEMGNISKSLESIGCQIRK